MTAERMTISLPAKTAKRMRDKARESGKPLSRVIADELEEREEARIRELMIEGYKATSEETRQFAEAALPLAAEVWPQEDPWW